MDLPELWAIGDRILLLTHRKLQSTSFVSMSFCLRDRIFAVLLTKRKRMRPVEDGAHRGKAPYNDRDAEQRLREASALAATEEKPPDNVVFVSMLNPVTEDKDLFKIFSRFGTVQAVDVVRDKSGVSMRYAFIEFETREACEEARFKMNNEWVHKRKIRVETSQSVANLWYKYKREEADKANQKHMLNNTAYNLEQDSLSSKRRWHGAPSNSRGSGSKKPRDAEQRLREASAFAATPRDRRSRPTNGETVQQSTEGNHDRGAGHGNNTRGRPLFQDKRDEPEQRRKEDR